LSNESGAFACVDEIVGALIAVLPDEPPPVG
jgi:hypothetical protein